MHSELAMRVQNDVCHCPMLGESDSSKFQCGLHEQFSFPSLFPFQRTRIVPPCPPRSTMLDHEASAAAKSTFERAQCVIVSQCHAGGNWNVSVAVAHNLGCLVNNWPFISGDAAWKTQATNIWRQSFVAFRGNNN